MKAIALGAFGAALLASAASAAPLNTTTIGSAEVSNVDPDRSGLQRVLWTLLADPRTALCPALLLRPQLLPRPGLQLLRRPRLLRSRLWLWQAKVHHSRLVAGKQRAALRCGLTPNALLAPGGERRNGGPVTQVEQGRQSKLPCKQNAEREAQEETTVPSFRI